MEKKLLILGAGQYGHLVKELAECAGYTRVEFLDDNHPAAIGKLDEAAMFADCYCEAVVAIGNPEIRRRCLEALESAGFRIPALCHPRGYVYPSASVSGGCIIEAMAVVNSNATIEKGCILSAGAVVNHDSVVEDCCHIDCNAVVSARSRVPSGTKVTSGSVYGL